MLRNPGGATSTCRDRGRRLEMVEERLRDPHRRRARDRRQLHGRVAGPITVLGVRRSLEADRRQLDPVGDAQRAGGDGAVARIGDRAGELGSEAHGRVESTGPTPGSADVSGLGWRS